MNFSPRNFFGRFTPGWQDMSEQDQGALTRRGLLAAGLGMLSAKNGGNFGASLSDGIQSGLLAMDQGVQGMENARYKKEILARTRQGMERNTAIEQAQQGAMNPDGSINDEAWGRWAQVDPAGALEFRNKARPQAKWDPMEIYSKDPRTGEPGYLSVLRNMETQELRDLQGKVISQGFLSKDPFGTQPQTPPNGGQGQGVPSLLDQAVMQVESGGNPAAMSPKGALGTMQTMPGTLADPGYGVAPAETQAYVPKMLQQAGGQIAAAPQFGFRPARASKQSGQAARARQRAPSGYQYTSDGTALMPIPGGPADRKGKAPGTAGSVIDNWDGTTTYIPAGKTSEGERNASGFFSRMVESNAEMQRLEGAGYDPTNRRDYYTAGGEVLNPLATDEGQQYRQAQNNWVRANLRKESGAAIGRDEMEQERRTYFPIPGDSPGVIEQKARARQVTERAMRSAAGGALPVPPGRAAGAEKGRVNVPPAAVEYLRKNPAMRSAFEQKYGVSADDYLR